MIETLSKVNIRKASSADKPQIIELIIEFYKESLREYGIKFDLETLSNTVQNFIDNHIGIVAEQDNKIIGVIGGTVIQSIFSENQKFGQEAIWFVTKESRTGRAGYRLITEFEKECFNRGASLVIMIHMSNLYPEELSKLYRMNNYKLLECHYIKGV